MVQPYFDRPWFQTPKFLRDERYEADFPERLSSPWQFSHKRDSASFPSYPPEGGQPSGRGGSSEGDGWLNPASDVRLRNSIEYNADGILIIDSSGCVQFANLAAEALFGQRREALIGQNLFDDLIDRDTDDLELESLSTTPLPRADAARMVQTHTRVTRRDGTYSIAEMQVVELEWHGNAATSYLATLRDVTARISAERERDRFFTLSLDLLCVLDFEGRFKRFNPCWQSILGFEEMELRSQRYLDFVHPDDRADTQAAFAALEGGVEKLSFENRCRTRDGQYRAFLWNAVAFAGDRTIYASGRDISDRKAAEAQLIQAEKMSGIGQLVAGVAHEINNPINFIYGNLQYIETYTKDLLHLLGIYQEHCQDANDIVREEEEAVDLPFVREDLPKVVSSMKVGADRVREIVSSLRNFTRLDEAEVKAVDLHQGLDNTLTILGHRLKPSGSKPGIEIEKTYGNLPPVECFAGQLNQVFMNLLANAIDALEERYAPGFEPRICIATACDRNGDGEVTAVSIAIGDNGGGIPERARARLFEPFFTTKPVGKGTGLGLAICYQIVVERHGGSIECQSALGEGTTFYLNIPVRRRST